MSGIDPADPRPRKSCPFCGESILAESRKCRYCLEYLDPELRATLRPAHGLADRMLFPAGRPLSAIFAGYLGLLSLVPLVGIAAIVASIVALGTLRGHPELSGRGRAIFGLVMGSLMTLFYTLVLVLTALGA